jgi:hypothetical protein
VALPEIEYLGPDCVIWDTAETPALGAIPRFG